MSRWTTYRWSGWADKQRRVPRLLLLHSGAWCGWTCSAHQPIHPTWAQILNNANISNTSNSIFNHFDNLIFLMNNKKCFTIPVIELHRFDDQWSICLIWHHDSPEWTITVGMVASWADTQLWLGQVENENFADSFRHKTSADDMSASFLDLFYVANNYFLG